MLTYNLENTNGKTLYEYIYECIKEDILSGQLRADEKLPSKRSFASHLGVSVITIEGAYDLLSGEGYIYSLPKKGFYVSDITGIARIRKKTSEALALLKFDEPALGKNEVINLSSNRVSPESFPFSIWSKVSRDVMSFKSAELMEPSMSAGTHALRRSIANHLESFRGMKVSPHQIIVGAGTEYLYSLLIQLLGRDKKYCLEDPGYRKISQIYESNGVKCCYAGLDDMGIKVADLEKKKANIAHITPTHHFPTGITMPIKRRYELLAWADKEDDRYIIEDDYDSEFRLGGKLIPSLQSIDGNEKVIYINTFSKSLSSTIRISYMVLPPHLTEEFYEKLSFYSCTVSNFEQYTLSEFINRGYFEKHLNRMRLFYTRQREMLLKCINESPVKNKCHIIENDSGLHFLVRFDMEMSDEKFIRKLEASNVSITPVTKYYVSPPASAKHTFILNYSNITKDELSRAFAIIAEEIN